MSRAKLVTKAQAEKYEEMMSALAKIVEKIENPNLFTTREQPARTLRAIESIAKAALKDTPAHPLYKRQ